MIETALEVFLRGVMLLIIYMMAFALRHMIAGERASERFTKWVEIVVYSIALLGSAAIMTFWDSF